MLLIIVAVLAFGAFVLAVGLWCLLAMSAALESDAVSQEWIRTHVRDDR